MSTPIGCPDASTLEALLLGRLCGEAADLLAQHLDGCPACAQSLGQIRAEDELVAAIKGPPAAEWSATDRDILSGIVQTLRRFRPTGDTVSRCQGTPVVGVGDSGREGSFDFLSPPQGPDELGRLSSYRILQVLGGGGMGVVFLADDPRLQRQVALKVIRPELAARPGFKDRFLQEARAAAKLEHDRIVPIWHADEADGIPFIAMPVLRGQSLEACLREAGGPLPVAEVLSIGEQIAEGLAAAHERGLIHRDIKPANIWLETVESGGPKAEGEEKTAPGSPAVPLAPLFTIRVRILDFGLARTPDNVAPGQTEGLAGTPAYMAPEQARGDPVDSRADLFSLGCVLYRMLAGRSAFQGDTAVSVLLAVATDEPLPLRAARPEPPRELCDLVHHLLAKRPEDRPATAREVADALAEMQRQRQPRPSRRRWLLATAALVLIACGLTAWLVHRNRQPVFVPQPPPEPGEVTFDPDEAINRLVLVQGEDEQTIDPRNPPTRSLPPGDYVLKPAGDVKERRLLPGRITVEAGAKQTVKLALVGEIDYHRGHSLAVMGLAVHFGKDRTLAISGSQDRRVAVWDIREPKPRFCDHGNPVRCVAITSDGKRLASAGGGRVEPDLTIHLWHADTLQPVGEPLAGHKNWVNALAFSPDGKQLLSGDADGVVLLWDLARRTSLPLEGHKGPDITSLAFAPDGARALSAGSDGLVILWNVRKAETVSKLEAHPGGATAVVFLDDGSFLSAGKDGRILLWDDKKEKPTPLLQQKAAVLCLAISADKTRLLAGDAEGKLRLLELPSGNPIECPLEGHRGEVKGVALSPDGTRAFSAGDLGVRYWQLPR
jgi:serine/threonine protein kinase/WD40 repeat protein